jgi:hypothetical protein
MQKLTRTTFKLIKTDEGQFINMSMKKMQKLLDQMAPGMYRLTIEKESTRLESMKKFYFQMETNLAQHLGMKKPDLHKALMSVFTIADIKDEEEMMARIIDFQNYAAAEHDYTTEPFSEER